jgi:hypothetical protein
MSPGKTRQNPAKQPNPADSQRGEHVEEDVKRL